MNDTWFKERKYAWIGLAALWIIGFIGALLRFIMATYQVQISQDLNISRSLISMAWSTNLLIAALCTPIGGWIADRYGPKKLMLLSTMFSSLGTSIVFVGHNSTLFFIGYGVISGFYGIGASATYILIFDWFQHHRAKATALLASSSSIGLAVCTPIFISNTWLTWKDAFLISCLLSLFVALPVIQFLIRNPENPQKKAKESEQPKVKMLFKGPHMLLFLFIGFALFTCGFNMGTVEMNLVAIYQLSSVKPALIAVSMSTLGIMEIIGSFIFGYLLDRINKFTAMSLLYGIRILAFIILFVHSPWSPIVFAVFFGFTYLGAVPGGMLIANENTKEKGKFIGSLLLFHQAGGIIGSLIGGVSFDISKSYQLLIGFDMLLCILVTIGYFTNYWLRYKNTLYVSRYKNEVNKLHSNDH
ncbi:MFS transporter [Clostridium beijerinckii]|uniref:MFS family permease n=1 Tax=Clostridium beijerinckii TaxID=1520 RepID=A0A9Q5CP85_CLOBE|nr:MFS transporter [Clostridium beijerinckii]AQS06414.1 putative sialic acid transporter [Clostridium beijerinckii]MBA2885790.1 MFS family permease [Clostridium beijerinckii]MBA2900509.1 MFS family permease [Clostridium beijerinckii]MBA2910349.1 MFS family permease [Clostridium beijerinckii]MBA9013967.1 MFS family permease [Clostridium beijerinckii]